MKFYKELRETVENKDEDPDFGQMCKDFVDSWKGNARWLTQDNVKSEEPELCQKARVLYNKTLKPILSQWKINELRPLQREVVGACLTTQPKRDVIVRDTSTALAVFSVVVWGAGPLI